MKTPRRVPKLRLLKVAILDYGDDDPYRLRHHIGKAEFAGGMSIDAGVCVTTGNLVFRRVEEDRKTRQVEIPLRNIIDALLESGWRWLDGEGAGKEAQ